MNLSTFALPAVAAIVCAAAPSAVQAAAPTAMSCNQPYGLRGQTVPFTITLRVNGVPLANQAVYIFDWSDNRPNSQFRGIVWTNSDGRATFYYTIPMNPAEDNVYLGAYYPGDVNLSWSSTYRRVEIGHRFP